jgi:hypothetical protein
MVQTQAHVQPGSAQTWQQQVLVVNMQLLAYRGEEMFEIPEIALHFWYVLYKALLRHQKETIAAGQGEGFVSASTPVEHSPPLFAEELTGLLGVCVHLCRIPSEEAGDDFGDALGEETNEVVDFRKRVADTLRDVTQLLGGPNVGPVFISLLQNVQQPGIDPDQVLGVPVRQSETSPAIARARVLQCVEAILFAFGETYKMFGDEAAAAVTPALVDQIAAFVAEPSLARRYVPDKAQLFSDLTFVPI